MNFDIEKGKKISAVKMVLYGPEGIGKSTICSMLPKPLFIDTEGSTSQLEVDRFPAPKDWSMLMDEIAEVIRDRKGYQTLVIDTCDWAEHLCIAHLCRTKGVDSIEQLNYGKGYVMAGELFTVLLNQLSVLSSSGMNIVLVAHSQIRKFEQPDELGSYDRWCLKLTRQISPIVTEWCDALLFANFKTFVITDDKNHKKAQGGERVLFTQHTPAFDAKNRYGLAEELPFKEESIDGMFMRAGVTAAAAEKIPKKHTNSTSLTSVYEERDYTDAELNILAKLPEKLQEKMKPNKVKPKEVQYVCELRGYVPKGTDICKYEKKFVDTVLIKAWDQVYKAIAQERDLPF